MISKNVVILLLVLILVSPLFGTFLVSLTGYREPLELAAEKLGLKDITEEINWSPLIGYSAPGLPPELGYILSGFIGTGLLLGMGYITHRLSMKVKKE